LITSATLAATLGGWSAFAINEQPATSEAQTTQAAPVQSMPQEPSGSVDLNRYLQPVPTLVPRPTDEPVSIPTNTTVPQQQQQQKPVVQPQPQQVQPQQVQPQQVQPAAPPPLRQVSAPPPPPPPQPAPVTSTRSSR
jgi:hypothetical protein